MKDADAALLAVAALGLGAAVLVGRRGAPAPRIVRKLAEVPDGFPTKGKAKPREISSIDAICVHTTGSVHGFDITNGWRRRAGWSGVGEPTPKIDQRAMLMRYLETPYHFVRTNDDVGGWIVAQWHPQRYTYHGDGTNRFSLGLAFDTVPSQGGQLDVGAARLDLAWAITLARLWGCPIRRIVAHRQGATDRAGDPGRVIWSEVVEPVRRVMLLDDASGERWGGYTIPEDWKG